MTSPFLGEFLGTMILILLGDGVVAGVLLKRSKGEGGGWLVITAGWAFAVMAGVFTAVACGSSDAHLNPAVTLGFAVVFLHAPRDTEGCSQPDQRNHRDSGAGVCCGSDFFQGRCGQRTGSAGTVSGREPRLGNRSFFGRHHRLRDKSGSRPGPARGARSAANRGQRQLGLGLCSDTGDRAARRWSTRRLAASFSGCVVGRIRTPLNLPNTASAPRSKPASRPTS